jgi:hypothetical protein
MRSNRFNRRGSSGVEFALSTFFWAPLLVGTFTVGFKLIEANRVAEIGRDVGHMYAYGTDFSQSGNQAIAQRLAQGFDLSTSGNGVLILSVVKMIGPSDCTSSGFVPANQTPNTTNCPNLNQYVISQRLYIGNTSLRSSYFGDPATSYLNAQGNVSLTNQVSAVGLRTSSFGPLLTLTASQFAYVTEAFFTSVDLQGNAAGGIYNRSIF